jgi:hypothetical protein
MRVINIKNSHRPLLHIQLTLNENNQVFKFNTPLPSAVVIEKLEAKRNSPSQYHTCQAYAYVYAFIYAMAMLENTAVNNL